MIEYGIAMFYWRGVALVKHFGNALFWRHWLLGNYAIAYIYSRWPVWFHLWRFHNSHFLVIWAAHNVPPIFYRNAAQSMHTPRPSSRCWHWLTSGSGDHTIACDRLIFWLYSTERRRWLRLLSPSRRMDALLTLGICSRRFRRIFVPPLLADCFRRLGSLSALLQRLG